MGVGWELCSRSVSFSERDWEPGGITLLLLQAQKPLQHLLKLPYRTIFQSIMKKYHAFSCD